MNGLASVTILGSGTSAGVPVIGCHCAVCKSPDLKNTRTRSSILLKHSSGEQLVVDTGPDFRAQALREGIETLDGVFYTHVHADHCHGFDDLRAFYFHHQTPVRCFVSRMHEEEFRSRFQYALLDTGYRGTAPQVDLQVFDEGRLQAGSFAFEVAYFPHGNIHTAGLRCGSFAYVTDFKTFPEEILAAWRGKIEVMVASGNNFNLAHPTHSTVQETAAVMKSLGVKRGVISHLAHEVEYKRDNSGLPTGIELAFDGMSIDLTP